MQVQFAQNASAPIVSDTSESICANVTLLNLLVLLVALIVLVIIASGAA